MITNVTRFLATSPQVSQQKAKVFIPYLFLFDTSENNFVEVLTTPSKPLLQTFEKCLFDLKKKIFKDRQKKFILEKKSYKKNDRKERKADVHESTQAVCTCVCQNLNLNISFGLRSARYIYINGGPLYGQNTVFYFAFQCYHLYYLVL